MSDYQPPEMYRPYPTRSHPLADAAGRHAKDWARRMGMLGTFWEERDIDELGAATFAARTHPDASESALHLLSEWHIWGFHLVAHIGDEYRRTRDIAGAKHFARRLPTFMPLDSAVVASPVNAAERGLADLWVRTAPSMPGALREQLRRNVKSYGDSHVEELSNLCQDRVPDPSGYLATRTQTFGVAWAHDLIRHTIDDRVPQEVFDTWPMRALLAAFFEATGPQSDARTYREDVRGDTKVNNGVHVYTRFLGCPPQRAGEVLNSLGTERLRRFENLAITEVPALAVELGMGLADGERLLRHIDHLRQFTAGTHDWLCRERTPPARRPSATKRLPGPPAAPTALLNLL
ncbi:terpene synthase family protein [Allokutzneria oryzae]|uniref:Terpene synthase n=1 Tax=Allokutzneria oryzae TaxID=1378989 RepID=A0ABV6A5J2_9PSEU